MKGFLTAGLTGLIMCVGCAFAGPHGGPHPGPHGRGEHREPPPEAYAACNGKSEGTRVEIKTPCGDTIKATCQLMNGKLFALPDCGPGGGPGKGPGGEPGMPLRN